MKAILIALLLAALAMPAEAATIDIGQVFGDVLQPYINAAVTGLITALIGWVLYIVKSKFNIEIEAKHREALTAFLQRQASGLVAAGAVKLQGVKVEVSNVALATAANAALNSVPQALAWFNLSPAKVSQMIVDLLPKEPAVADAAAIAIDVANPATPSKPA